MAMAWRHTEGGFPGDVQTSEVPSHTAYLGPLLAGVPMKAQPGTSAAAIQFHRVGKWHEHAGHTVTILDSISGTVPRGAIVTMVGPSGSGKSTLLSLCNLLTSPDAGDVMIHGQEVRQWSIPALRRRVGLVFQSPVMFPGTVLDNLCYGPLLRGEHLKNPEDFLRSVGLPEDLLLRRAGDLSGASSSASPSPAPWRTSPIFSCWMKSPQP